MTDWGYKDRQIILKIMMSLHLNLAVTSLLTQSLDQSLNAYVAIPRKPRPSQKLLLVILNLADPHGEPQICSNVVAYHPQL